MVRSYLMRLGKNINRIKKPIYIFAAYIVIRYPGKLARTAIRQYPQDIPLIEYLSDPSEHYKIIKTLGRLNDQKLITKLSLCYDNPSRFRFWH